MTINVGPWDRVIRMFVGLGSVSAAWATWPVTTSILTGAGIASLVFLMVGAVALVTGMVGWCPLYALLHVSTDKRAAA